MHNILIVNFHSSANKGDAGILTTTISILRDELPSARFVVFCHTPEMDGKVIDCKTCHHIYPPNRRRGAFGRILYLLRFAGASTRLFLWAKLPGRLRRRTIRLFPKSMREQLGEYLDADLVVSCGGGYFNWDGREGVFRLLLSVRLAQWLGKPTVLWPMSIGPFCPKGNSSRLWAILARFITGWMAGICRDSETVMCREATSLDFVKKLGIREPKAKLVPDSAFMIAPDKTDVDALLKTAGVMNDGPLIGITVRPWFFHKSVGGKDSLDQVLRSIAEGLDALIEREGCRVIFWPQVIGPLSAVDDRLVARRIREIATRKDRIHLVEDDLLPSALAACYDRMNILIGMRMHSNIFALAQHVPVLALEYLPKTSGIMRMLGLGEWVMETGEVSSDRISSRGSELLRRREEIRSLLPEKIERLRDQLREAAREVALLITQGSDK